MSDNPTDYTRGVRREFDANWKPGQRLLWQKVVLHLTNTQLRRVIQSESSLDGNLLRVWAETLVRGREGGLGPKRGWGVDELLRAPFRELKTLQKHNQVPYGEADLETIRAKAAAMEKRAADVQIRMVEIHAREFGPPGEWQRLVAIRTKLAPEKGE